MIDRPAAVSTRPAPQPAAIPGADRPPAGAASGLAPSDAAGLSALARSTCSAHDFAAVRTPGDEALADSLRGSGGRWLPHALRDPDLLRQVLRLEGLGLGPAAPAMQPQPRP